MTTTQSWRSLVGCDMEVYKGMPTLGPPETAVPVAKILGELANGKSVSEIARAYPFLSELHVYAAIAYAAEVCAFPETYDMWSVGTPPIITLSDVPAARR